jgi:hypothetical protein
LTEENDHVATRPSSVARAPANEPPLALFGVPLSNGVTLLITPSRPLAPHDLEAIRLAAAPLIRTLNRSRLINSCEEGETP